MECPAHCPMKCGPEEMHCPGGMDWNGCPEPDMCIPAKGPMGNDGTECPAFCPAKCGQDDMMCNGGHDANNCMMPDFCMPAKGVYESLKMITSLQYKLS